MKTDWQTKKLGEIGTIFNGNSINERVKKQKYLNLDDGFPFIATKDVDFETHSIDYENGVKIPFSEKSFKIAHKNSVLICAEGGSAGKKIAFNEKDICFGNKLFAIETKKDVEPKLVYYWYLTPDFFESFKKQMNGIIGGVSIGNFKNLNISLPTYVEQTQIVKKLDDIFEKVKNAKEAAEKNLQNAKDLFESYLQSVFVNPGKDWEDKKLGAVCGFVRGPFGGSLKKSIFKKEGYVVYEQQHAIYNQFTDVRYFVDEKKFNEMKRFELKPGDLIMSCSGTMGKIAIAPENIKRGIINQALLKLSPHDGLYNEFLKYWMESGVFQDDLKMYTKGAAIKNVVSVKILKEIKILVPKIQEQKSIVKKIKSFSVETKKLENIYEQKLADLEELKKSVLAKAFRGEL